MLADLISTGRIADLILALVVLEAVALCLYNQRTGAGIMPLDALSLLLPGAFLVLALRAALTQAWWGWIAAALALALLTHLFDLARRWRGATVDEADR